MLLVMVTGVREPRQATRRLKLTFSACSSLGAGGKAGRSFPTRWKQSGNPSKKHLDFSEAEVAVNFSPFFPGPLASANLQDVSDEVR